MTKNKLIRYSTIDSFNNIFQPNVENIEEGYFLKGKWNKEYFKNENPIVLELGCGKGEYTVGLAEIYKNKNFIGVDIKGARMFVGCKIAHDNNMNNVGFLRIQIEHLEKIFAKNEVNEIWITFPDPFLANGKAKKRLTSPRFLNSYKNIISQNGIIHLKTDNSVLYEYTLEVLKELNHEIVEFTNDLYNAELESEAKLFQTFYENKYLQKGLKINYIKFKLSNEK